MGVFEFPTILQRLAGFPVGMLARVVGATQDFQRDCQEASESERHNEERNGFNS